MLDHAPNRVHNRNRILAALPPGASTEIFAAAELVELRRGRVLYRQDAPIQVVYFPVSAVLSVLSATTEGGLVEMATVGNEGLSGISAVLGIDRALGRTIVQIGGDAFGVRVRKLMDLMIGYEDFRQIIHRYLYAFMRQMVQAGACNRLHSAEERCARWLLMIHDRAGVARFPITQEFVAEMLGARRATINVALASFRKAGAIEYGYRTVGIRDRSRLKAFSCTCYDIISSAYARIGF
jgi:CRP-like cAMP-binding protein